MKKNKISKDWINRQHRDIYVKKSKQEGFRSRAVYKLQESFPDRLFIEVRTEKAGLGTAYIHGFKWAIAKKYDYIFEMDADFSHNPNDLIFFGSFVE